MRNTNIGEWVAFLVLGAIVLAVAFRAGFPFGWIVIGIGLAGEIAVAYLLGWFNNKRI